VQSGSFTPDGRWRRCCNDGTPALWTIDGKRLTHARGIKQADVVSKIVALAEIFGPEATGRAITDAHELGAYSCEYIANLVEQRQRLTPEPGALHLTRASDLLALELPPPDLSPYRSSP
jgi:hypothetical protein